ncbi:FMN-dependent NADH-azoreductase [Photobacterium sp. OFAV2-7]|uniref:FMN-dependent NADH-azoreductase n=1 Tax=Photobacterium sp. OFAV2-7 TaxID=2917748 RepID=UPI001EF7169A|nr:NAD(P)H-dependent oxidoreductase [Photobacterium sp. OFAV2-7]MCG7585416.1 NAD(P)H-dependent oxidoreductase [Photobacterium sp. OFAV2-7]
MKTILHIDTSARRTDNEVQEYNSISKTLAATFMDKWMTVNNEDKVIYRDLGSNPPEFISQDWIAAVFTPDDKKTIEQKQLLTLSDTLIEELDQADIILISSPMYNYGMPAVLKAWFDQVIRINKTFSFDLARGDFPLEPIMSGKTLVLISSSGEFGFEIGGIREKMNHLGTHIEVLGRYLGVEKFYEIKSEYQEFGDERHEKSFKDALVSIEELVTQLS